jgi:hypothetical protein
LEVTTKSVERTAEAIGADIAQREQAEIQKALQLELPVMAGEPIPVLYVQMDGTGVPVVKKETVGRQGKTEDQPAHTREVKLGCVFTQTTWDKEGYAIRDPDSTTYTGAIESAEEFGRRIYEEGHEHRLSFVNDLEDPTNAPFFPARPEMKHQKNQGQKLWTAA